MINPMLVMRLLVALALAGALYFGYSHVKQIGYDEAAAKYSLIIKGYEEDVNKKIDALEVLSSTLVVENRKNNISLSKDMQDIKEGIKKKPLIVVKDGECTPAPTFSEAIVKINVRANQSVKGTKQ